MLGIWNITQGDAVERLRALPDQSVDLILTDPAYDTMEEYRRVGTTTRLKDWFPTFPTNRFPALFMEFHRVLKKNSHLYVFSDTRSQISMVQCGEQAGFRYWKGLIWDKKAPGMGYHYKCRYEFILFFEKGKRRLSNLGVPDILSYRRPIGKHFPTEKPVDLLRVLVLQSSGEGDVVVDPFSGSGNVGVAAVSEGRNFVGSDIWTVAVEESIRRLEQVGV